MAAARELRFITIDVPPWASFDAARQPRGVFPDLMAELARRSGHPIRITLAPFARIERELEAGAQDCTVIIWNDARERIVERGAFVAPHRMGVVARKGVTLRTYEELKPLRISVLRGAAITPRFDADPAIRKEYDTDYLIGLRKLAHGRADAVAGALATLRHLARGEGLEGQLGEELLLAEVPLVLQCSRSSPALALMPELNRAVESMVSDGTVDRIRREHGL